MFYTAIRGLISKYLRLIFVCRNGKKKCFKKGKALVTKRPATTLVVITKTTNRSGQAKEVVSTR